jgi:uncharacterized protein (DUF302 family)
MDTYGRRLTVDLPFGTAVEELVAALNANGVAILGRHDLRAFLDRYTQHDFREYALLEVAMPGVVLESLREDLTVGAVLPTTIAVFELADGETAVVVSEPFAALGSDAYWRRTHPHLAALADLTCDRLGRALKELEEAGRTAAALRALVS